MKYKANPNILTNDLTSPTPIFYALQDSTLLNKLLKAGANPNETNCDGHTPLYKACELSDDTVIPEILLKHDANIDPENCRPLFVALTNRHLKLS